MQPFLLSIGATSSVRAAFAPFASQGLELARVAQSSRDQYQLLSETGACSAEPAGTFLYMAASRVDLPAVGDWVAMRRTRPDEAIVHALLPRRTKFSRRAVGAREDEQVISANIDVVFVVTGLDGDFNLRRIERYLTLAHESGADPVIVLSKSDLCANLSARLVEAAGIAGGAPVLAISALTPEGIAPVQPYIQHGTTVALLGSSGAGKSTLLNRLLGDEYMPTQAVRESDSRGRHTTTHRELIPLPQGGALIDNPGMRELQLWASQDSLDETFDDIASLAAACRFHDCIHASEPGCEVRAALEAGSLSAQRWASYEKLLAEIRYHEAKTDIHAAQARKQKWKAIHKAMRHNKQR